MFLSIIIPVYKVELYLRECLDSIASSPLDCWEAILIDDGSPDGCPHICDEYAAKDKRFRVIHQENKGVAAARNAGLNVAQGEWAWFVDSDDVVDMRPIERIMEWIKKENEKVDLVMFDLKTFNDGVSVPLESGASAPMVRDEMLDKNMFLLQHVCYHHQRLWYRRGWLNHHQRPIRFSLGIRVAEDLEFQYKYLTLCQCPVKVENVLYYYRLRESSATGDATYRERAVEDLPIVLKHLAMWSLEHHVLPEPWFDYRIMKMFQNLLYSASLVKNLETKQFQQTVRNIVLDYRMMEFPFVNGIKARLANMTVQGYFLFNKIYLRVKGIR